MSCEWVIRGSHWKWKVLLCCVLLNLFIAPPRLDLLWSRLSKERAQLQGRETDTVDYWDMLDIKIAHPFTNMAGLFQGRENFAKRTFRIVPCLAAHLLHLGKPGFFMLQAAAGCGLIFLLASWFERLSGDRMRAAILTALVSTTYFGQAAFFDTNGWGDAFAYFFLTWAVVCAKPWQCSLAVFLAGFTDEWALPCALFAVLSHAVPATSAAISREAPQHPAVGSLLRDGFTWAVLGGWAACLLVRWALAAQMQYAQPYGLIGFPILFRFETLHHFAPSLFLTMKLSLVPLVLLPFCAWGKGMRTYLSLFGCGVLASVGLAFAVLDHTRSLAYLGPACLVALQILHLPQFRHILQVQVVRFFVLGNLLCPTASIVFDMNDGRLRVHEVEFLRPLPVELCWLGQKLVRKLQ